MRGGIEEGLLTSSTPENAICNSLPDGDHPNIRVSSGRSWVCVVYRLSYATTTSSITIMSGAPATKPPILGPKAL